jgi:hypothetical protein
MPTPKFNSFSDFLKILLEKMKEVKPKQEEEIEEDI